MLSSFVKTTVDFLPMPECALQMFFCVSTYLTFLPLYPYSSISVAQNSTLTSKQSLCTTLSVTFALIIPARAVLPWDFIFYKQLWYLPVIIFDILLINSIVSIIDCKHCESRNYSIHFFLFYHVIVQMFNEWKGSTHIIYLKQLQNPYDFNIIYFRYLLEIKLKTIMETIHISKEFLIFYLEA